MNNTIKNDDCRICPFYKKSCTLNEQVPKKYPSSPYPYCDVKCPRGWVCNRAIGHKGEHEAHESCHNDCIARWGKPEIDNSSMLNYIP